MTTGQAVSNMVTSWKADLAHSGVTFRIRNFFGTVSGSFDLKEAAVDLDEAASEATVHAVIDAAGVHTGSSMRDEHIKGEGFLDVDNHPEMTFRGAGLRLDAGGESGELAGQLTIHGVTNEVTLKLRQLGRGYYPLADSEALVVEGETEIDRNDFGVTQNMPWGDKTLLGNKLAVRIELLLLPAVGDDK